MSVNGVRQQTKTGRLGCIGSFKFIGEEPQMSLLAASVDLGRPFLECLIPANTTIGRGGASATRVIVPVLALGDDSQVGSPIVKAVTVDMVTFETIATSESEQFPVHKNFAGRGGVHSVALTVQMPATLTDPFSVGCIHKSVRSDRLIMSAKGDTYGILRLHRLTPSGGVLCPFGGINTVGALLHSLYHPRRV